MRMGVILASASPRRKRLLKGIVRNFTVRAAHIGERIRRGEPFANACVRLAEAKARKVADGKSIVIGADTIAYRGKKVYRKTGDVEQARRILLELRGKMHHVVTGVCVLFPDGKKVGYFANASVRMDGFSDALLASYLRCGEWRGRAGSYDISGKGRLLVRSVKGERETVVGLPVLRLRRLFLRR